MTVFMQGDDEVVDGLRLGAHLAEHNACACVACSDDDDSMLAGWAHRILCMALVSYTEM